MRSLRRSIVVITSCLLSVGVIMIFSSSGVHAMKMSGSQTYYLYRHLLFLIAGLGLMLAVMSFDYREIRHYAKPMLLFALVLLLLVLIPQIGKSSFGARRWFRIGPFNFQPSEFMKIAMMIYAADYLARKKHVIREFWKGFAPLIMIIVLVCLLIVKQPDLGNSILIACIVLSMMFVAGVKLWHLASLAVVAMVPLYWLVFNVPYRLRRIVAFLDPWEDSLGAGFQLTQSQIALGSGGIFGVGLGKSIQKLFYLPAAHTDFILSIIGEELGLLGTLGVVFLFIALIWQSARICKRTSDPFGYFLGVGIIAMIGLQAVVNIGVSIGALPTKGLPLPFISYGGSALVFNLMAVGLLLNISKTEELSPQ